MPRHSLLKPPKERLTAGMMHGDGVDHPSQRQLKSEQIIYCQAGRELGQASKLQQEHDGY
jgi:hypothetical protein